MMFQFVLFDFGGVICLFCDDWLFDLYYFEGYFEKCKCDDLKVFCCGIFDGQRDLYL